MVSRSIKKVYADMSNYDREYEAFRIFEQVRDEQKTAPSASQKKPGEEKSGEPVPSLEEDVPFYEIEYDACPLPGVGKFVLKSQKVSAPVKDEIREKFNQMRDIARKNQYLYYENSRFYDKRIREENSKIFYEQGRFMEDFEDHYEKEVPFSAYFPGYQMMGYEQLRTYFTWRTRVRQGEITDTSTSYLFLYLYELLNQIGVKSEEEGLEKLMDFWMAVRSRQGAVGKYVLRWVKDYHVYYELPWPFKEFIERNGLNAYYPELSDSGEHFELLCGISKYDLRKSAFYGDGREALIKDCFHFMFSRLKQVFADKGLDLEAMIFQPAKNMPRWTPFKDALFYPVKRQTDRRVVLSEKEIYLCSNNQWTFNTTLTTESGKRLIGYIMKLMESVLRKTVKYKYKISAGSLGEQAAEELKRSGINLEEEVTKAVPEFYRERTKTVVTVNPDRLRVIRQEALQTQEKLTVPEEEIYTALWQPETAPERTLPDAEQKGEIATALVGAEQEEETSAVLTSPRQKEEENEPSGQDNPWMELGNVLTEVEREALRILWKKETDIRQFADSHGIMLEVLAEGINEKAMDCVGDGLLDAELVIYEDYREQIEEMLSNF